MKGTPLLLLVVGSRWSRSQQKARDLLGNHGEETLLDVFEGQRQLIADDFMWVAGLSCRRAAGQAPAVGDESDVGEPAYLHSRRHQLCSAMPRAERLPMAKAMRRRHTTRASATAASWGWDMPWTGRAPHMTRNSSTAITVDIDLACDLRDGHRKFENVPDQASRRRGRRTTATCSWRSYRVGQAGGLEGLTCWARRGRGHETAPLKGYPAWSSFQGESARRS